jgi:hypothetical protein
MNLLDRLLGCSHGRCSFPITLRSSGPNASSLPSRTYIVCLECGKEFPYDWREMKLLRRSAERHHSEQEFAIKRSA